MGLSNVTPPDPPRRLGRGLDALLAKRVAPAPAPATDPAAAGRTQASGPVGTTDQQPASGLQNLSINQVRPNPFQPRKEFRPEELADLEASLRTNGLLQPITVRPAANGSGFELIAGERRLRAATRLGWKDIPAVVRDADDRTMLTLALIENLQRADLDAIEEAEGYQRLIDEFALSNQEVADVVGKDRSTVANALRLLQLPASVRRLVQERQLTAGHARALLGLSGERAIVELAREVASNGLSVREVERRVKLARETPKPNTTAKSKAEPIPRGNAAELRRIEDLLKKRLQTDAHIHMEGKERGEIRLTFYSADDLERLIEELGVNLDAF